MNVKINPIYFYNSTQNQTLLGYTVGILRLFVAEPVTFFVLILKVELLKLKTGCLLAITSHILSSGQRFLTDSPLF